MDADFTAVGAIDQHFPNGRRQLAKRRIQTETVGLGQRSEQRVRKALRIRRALPSHHGDAALVQRQRRIRDHQVRIKFHLVSESRAFRAGAVRIVERETPGLDFLDADAAVRAGEIRAEGDRAAVHRVDQKQPVCQSQHGFDGIRKSFFDARLHNQPVNDNLNIVLLILVELDLFGQLILIPVHHHTDIAALLRLLEGLLMAALPSSHNRRQQLDPRPLRQRHDLVHHLVHALPPDLPSAVRAVGHADPGVKQPEVVVDLRHRPHRGTGVPVGRLLVDGNRGRKPLDALDVRLFHLPEELSCVGGQ